jgi:hypothetical protein
MPNQHGYRRLSSFSRSAAERLPSSERTRRTGRHLPHLFRRLLPLALVGVSGCKLIDQATFAPQPELPAPSPVAAVVQTDRRAPLLIIRYDVPDPPYREALGGAVQAAEKRGPAIEYDVVSVVPGGGAPPTPTAQDRRNAVEVMRSIMRLGVPDSRIHLGLRTDPAATAREVRVYVR